MSEKFLGGTKTPKQTNKQAVCFELPQHALHAYQQEKQIPTLLKIIMKQIYYTVCIRHEQTCKKFLISILIKFIS